MLDAKMLRSDFDKAKALLAKRNKDYHLEQFLDLDQQRRTLIQEVEELKSRQNAVSKEVPRLKKEGRDVTAILAEMKELSGQVKELDQKVAEVDSRLEAFMLSIPNTPNESVPEGADDSQNLEMRKWGEPTKFDFEPKPHWEIGEEFGILDPATASKVTGTRFMIYKGLGARLERAIINFMLDTHVEKHGYVAVSYTHLTLF